MKTLSCISLLSSAFVVAGSASALADDEVFDHAVAPVDDAIEIAVGGGYTQGVGEIAGEQPDVQDVAEAGGGAEVQIGYRLLPQLTLGVYGTLSAYSTGDSVDSDTDVLGASAGIKADYHFRADRSVDPWVSLGTGWRGLWLDPSTNVKTTALQGLELARLQVGLDYRISEDLSLAPVIGASATMFLSQDSPMTEDYTELDDKKVNFQFFSGLIGRFDVLGTRGGR